MSHSPAPLRWNFSQTFGDLPPSDHLDEDDTITAIEFEKHGDYLAIGDQGGRVSIFERDDRNNDLNHQYSRKTLEQQDSTPARHPKFRFKLEFQSHEREIDYFKNGEIAQKIKKVRWCITQNGLMFILSANDKTIKLWKLKEGETGSINKEDVPLRFLSSENVLSSERSFMSGGKTLSSANGYHFERMENMSRKASLSHNFNDAKIAGMDKTHHTKCRKVYANAHTFNINSISKNSDGETFISADDRKINLWNLEVTDQCFNIVDMKRPDMEELDEMITSAEFHPIQCNLLAYGSSRGLIRLCDLRQAAICDRSKKIFLDGSLFRMKSLFEEVTACISDVKYVEDGLGGQHLLSRDYMNMKLWDMRMVSCPVAIFRIHEHLRPRLPELYCKDHIFDQFDCCFSGDGLHFATGSYSNLLKIFSLTTGSVEDIKPDIIGNIDRRPLEEAGWRIRRSSISNLKRRFYQQAGGGRDDDLFCNLNSKLLCVDWHPTSNLVACAAQSCLIFYHS